MVLNYQYQNLDIKMFVIHSYYLKGAYKDVFVLEESNNNLFRN